MLLTGVGYRYSRRAPWVLDRVELDLAPGSLTRIGGYNGTGKSTLMRIVAGAHRPGRGRVADRPARAAYVPGQLPADGVPGGGGTVQDRGAAGETLAEQPEFPGDARQGRLAGGLGQADGEHPAGGRGG